MSILARLKDKMTGRMSPEEEEIKRRADARAAEYEAATGEAAPEEEGIEAIPVEDAVAFVTPVGALKTGAKAAAKGAAKSGILSRIRDLFPSKSSGEPPAPPSAAAPTAPVATKPKAEFNTRDANAELRKASPRTREFFLNTKEGQQALSEGGIPAIQKYEQDLVSKTRRNAEIYQGVKQRGEGITGPYKVQKKYRDK